MSKAVIETGGKQYLVAKGDIIDVEFLGSDTKTVNFVPLLTTDGENTKVGKPEVSGVKVAAKVIDQVRDDKVTAIRFKAKKRVHKKRGHKQQYSRIEITKIG